MRRMALYQQVDTPSCKVFVLKHVEKETTCGSVVLVWTRLSGWLISGDFLYYEPLSIPRYGVGWFSSELGDGYLFEKVKNLNSIFDIEYAIDVLKDELDQLSDDECEDIDEDEFFALYNLNPSSYSTAESFFDRLQETEWLDFDPCDAGGYYTIYTLPFLSLIAIQERFAQLYHTDLRKL